MTGRKPSAAMPVVGYQCFGCLDEPFVPTGGSRLDPISANHAFGEFLAHRQESHAQGGDLSNGVQVIGRVRLGPAGAAAVAASAQASASRAA